MKNPFAIRPLLSEDAEEVSAIARASWEFTYGDIFSAEEIDRFVSRNYSVKSLKWAADQLPSDKFEFLVMEDTRTERLVGFCQIGLDNYWEEDDVEYKDIKLFRIYFHPDYIGKGLGARLLDRSEEFVKRLGRTSYYLKVHQDNKIGRRFYDKLGFARDAEKDEGDELGLRKEVS